MEMNVSQAREYLVDNHDIDVTSSTIIKWIKHNYIEGWQDVSHRWYTTSGGIDKAVSEKKIPPTNGMQRRYSDEQKARMKRMKMEGYTLKQMAEKYGCDQSYVSYVYRGLS